MLVMIAVSFQHEACGKRTVVGDLDVQDTTALFPGILAIG